MTREGEEGKCGWCKDAFGISWQIVPAKLGKWITDPVHGQASMQAMLQMKKLVITDLRIPTGGPS
ncbi:MAG: VOC family protein [Lewinellaceae bacterium]|nr:VOC family protein [Kiritimatiellia bacterium]MCB9313297.1 VOC family protein [Lewinellaceae bacterium]